MAITYQSAASDTDQRVNGNNLVFNISPIEGDVVYLFAGVGHDDTETPSLAATGYTQLTHTRFDQGDKGVTLYVARKVQGATPDTSVTVTLTGGDNAMALAGAARVYRGVDTTTPEDATTTTATGDSANPDPPSITTATANAFVVASATAERSANYTGFPSGYGNTQTTNQNDTHDANIGAADLEKATAGAENPGTFTMNVSDVWVTATVAIRPAGAGGATGTGDFSVSAPEMSAQGGQTFEGALTAEVSTMELSASGIMLPAGAGDFQAATPSLTASGVQTITGNMDADVAAAVLTAQGFMQPDGAAVFDMSSLVLTAQGTHGETTDGIATINIAELVLAASGAQIFVGSAPFVIPALTLTTQGYLQPDGITSIDIASATLVASATEIMTGVASPEVQQAVLAASARMEPAGQGDLTVSAPNFDASGALLPIGSASFVIPVLVLNAQGELVGLIWTPTNPGTGNWSAVAAKGGVWTPTTPEDGTWTAT